MNAKTLARKIVENELESLFVRRAELETLELAKTQEIKAILTDEQRQALIDIENVYRTREVDLKADIGRLETSVKDRVLALGTAIKGQMLKAVLAAGRVTWNAKDMEYFLEDHPEILEKYPDLIECKRVGSPYVAIRKA